MQLVLRGITVLLSVIVMVNFANWWSGGFSEGLMYALLGAYGNTIFALLAVVASLFGVARYFVGRGESLGAKAIKKVLFVFYGLTVLMAIFGNGTLAYLKFQSENGSDNLYVLMLGSPFLEIAIIISLLAAMMVKDSKVDE